jgi:hypothetical protein
LLKKTTITIMGRATEDEMPARLGNSRRGPMRDGKRAHRGRSKSAVGLPIPEVADFVRRCERAALNGVGVHDHHSGRDVYVAIGMRLHPEHFAGDPSLG